MVQYLMEPIKIHPLNAGRFTQSGGATRYFLRFIQRSRQPFPADAESRRDRGSATDDADRSGYARAGHRNDSGVFPASARRSERNFGTWQGRLPQGLRVRGITTVEEANRFLRESYIAELNRKFSVPAAQPESAFVPVSTWTAPGACSTDRTWWAAMPRTAHTMGAPNRLFRREAKAI